jgi:hypothetical protein
LENKEKHTAVWLESLPEQTIKCPTLSREEVRWLKIEEPTKIHSQRRNIKKTWLLCKRE